jgi:hypothetical protein
MRFVSELLVHRALFGCSLRSLRYSLGCRRLRRIWRNGKALFRHLLLQIGGANIVKPPASSSLTDEKHVCSLLLSSAAARLRTLAARVVW